MPDLKISIVTVTFNAERTIKRCIQSVINQSFKNLEYIIIDGNSNDKTVEIINTYKKHLQFFISEPDEGIYDAINKGIKAATGDVVGLLNADDFFTSENILNAVSEAFIRQNFDIVYGDLDYINSREKVVRRWRSGKYFPGMFNWGWMPPHPAFYCKRALFDKFGYYSLDYGTAADYELMVRFMHKNKLNVFYLNEVMVKMTVGGASNKELTNRVKAWQFDLKAMRKNGILFPVLTLFFKPVRKIVQYF